MNGRNLVMDSLVKQLMISLLTWQGIEAVKEMVFHRSHKNKFEPGHRRALSWEKTLQFESYFEDKLADGGDLGKARPLVP